MTDAAPSLPSKAALAASKTSRTSRFRLRIAKLRDPRYGQICAQALLLWYGVTELGFRLTSTEALAAVGGALIAELIGRLIRKEPFDPLSPIISAGSLALLFRAQDLWLFPLAGFLAVASKFLFRLGGRHIFNPTALVLFAIPFAAHHGYLEAAWVSPGQWGSVGLEAVVVAGIGTIIVTRAARLDTTLAFLLAWALMNAGRVAYYGETWDILVHRLQSGAVFVFAFFMISDPATTPPTRLYRILHAVLVAALGFWLQDNWHTDTGPIWALVFLAPLVGGARLLANRRHRRNNHAPA